ncbi:CD48 antigen-like isoform X5 [Esox lucius]|uniref:CD48 antigen-like isoform X5 n=1 Tax=Esox lucius TaxID=8010 RepID=UPI001476FB88|nr:CD48 antigen-like isoform X5 [Esox lucius]
MLTQVVGESITFSNPVKQGGSLLYNGSHIAVVVKGNMDSSYLDSFKDRIQWDQPIGQFTIRNLKTNDSGMYVVEVSRGVKTTYQLTVYEPVSRPMLTTADNQSCSVECSLKNDRDVTLSWYSGEEIFNQTSSPDLSIKLFLPLEVDKQNRMFYICEAANPVTKENVMFYVPESCMVTNMTDPSEGEQPDIEYAEISYIIPTSIQEKQIDISEVDLPRETEVTVYEKLQLHRMADSDDEGKVKQRSRQMI